MVIAQALCENIKENKLAQTIVATGFKDTTRLALSNTEMANDMVSLNKDNIISSFESFYQAFENILNDDYKTKAEKIKNFRKNLYD